MKSDPHIVELDFGMGNIRSLQKALEYLGPKVEVIQYPEKIQGADALVLPGDGAFGKAMENIHSIGFFDAIKDFIKSGKPVLGVCIGFQILFETTEEFDYQDKGFSLFSGNVSRFNSEDVIIPHMGWNQVSWSRDSILHEGIENESYFYFVHSYRVSGIHPLSVGICDYAGTFTAVVEKENLFGVQFHPEKSYKAGLKLLENFIGVI